MADGVAEQRFRPFQLAHQLFGVGVDEQLVGVEAMTVLRVVGPVHAIAIDLTGVGVGQVAVPDLVGVLGQFDALDLGFTAGIEQAQLHFVACAEKMAKFTPKPSQVAPRGKGRPSRILEGVMTCGAWGFFLLIENSKDGFRKAQRSACRRGRSLDRTDADKIACRRSAFLLCAGYGSS